MRTLLIVLGAILSLLILAVLVGPLLIDWNAFKPRLAEAVESATGRQLQIEGDLSLSLLPTPTLSAAGARLSNVEGGSEPTMVSIDTLEVQVALAPLLGGDLQVESLVLVEPTILLERLADGRVNWELSPAAPSAPGRGGGDGEPAAPDAETGGDTGGEGGTPLSVTLERVVVEDGSLIYRDAVAGTTERLEALDATLRAESLRGPFLLEGRGRVRGTAAEFSFSTGQLALAGATPVTLVVTLPEAGAAEARFSGRLTAGEEAALAGELTLGGQNLLALAELAVPDAGLPGTLAQAYRLSADLDYGGAALALSEIDLSMADTAVAGSTRVAFGEPTDLSAELTVSRLDLDALLRDGGGGGQDPAVPVEAAAGLAGDFALPDGLRAQLDLQIGALVYRGEVVRQVLVNADLQQDRLALNQALALLPGGGNVVLSGDLTEDAGLPRFVGQLEATADNLRAVLAWLGVGVEGVPSDRLRRTSLLAAIDATPQQASITGIDLEIDTSRITGGVALALRERLGVGLGLNVDRINLDAYIPQDGASASPPRQRDATAEGATAEGATAEGARGAERQQQEQADADPGDPGQAASDAAGAAGAEGPDAGPPAATGGTGAAGLVGAIDANIDLTLGQVTYNGQAAREVTLDGTLQQGRLNLRRLTVGDLAGGAFSLSGVFTGLPDAPSVEDGSFDISVSDTGRLSRLLGQPADGVLAQLGGFRASGSASGSAQGFTYNADVTALGGSIFSSGRVSGLPDAVALRDARLQASGLEGPALARVAGLPDDSPLARLDRVELTSQFDYGPDAATYDTRLKTLGAEFVAEGRASELASGLPRVDFRFAAIHESLPTLLRRALGESPLAPGAGKLDLRAQVSGTPLDLTVSELRGDAGPTIESGTLRLDLLRATPKLTASLQTREIDLVRLFGPGGGGGQDPAPRWSRQPLQLEGLRALDAEIELTAEALRQDRLVLAPAELVARLEGGLLTVERLRGNFFDGSLTADARLDASGEVPQADLDLRLEGVDAGELLRALGTDRVDGRVDLQAALSSRGRSEAALVTALAGEGRVGGELTVEARAQEQVGNVVLGILGQQVKELRGVTNPLNELFSAFAGRPGQLSGTVRVGGGVATTQDLQLAGNGARLAARGTLANLPAWSMALNAALYRQQAAEPAIEIDLEGALDQPNLRLRGAGLSITPGSQAPEASNPLEQILRQAVPGARQPSSQDGSRQPSNQLEIAPEPAPEGQEQQEHSQPTRPQAPKAEDVLRGLIQGLGQGG